MRSLCVLAALVGLGALGNARQSPVNWTPLSTDLPKGVQFALPAGAKPASDILHLAIAMPYGNAGAMQAFVDSVSDPKSPSYRHFITPTQIGSQFGIGDSQVQKVTAYLKSQGMTVRLVSRNHLSILADATVAQAQLAFNTVIEDFLPLNPARDGWATRFSFTTQPNVPAAIRPFISYIGGLENFTQPIPQAALTPTQLRTLYGVAPVYSGGSKGQGRTIAISNFDGYRLSNVPLFYSQFGLPSPSGGVGTNITVKSINLRDGNTAYARVEGDLDIQTVLAQAPLCNLIVYDDAQDSDLLSVLSLEAEDNSADIISESYGWSGDAAFNLAAHNLHLALNAQGITYAGASGDFGTNLKGGPYPGEDPEVLAVGGTTPTIDASGNRLSESTWSGSGGGWVVNTDPFNVLPTYQKGTGVPTNVPYRLIPDIAFDANPYTGYQIYLNGTLVVQIGGTSGATPTFAGALADCEQQIIAGGGLPADAVGKQRFGRIQDLLYSFNGDPNVFFDVKTGTNGTLPNGSVSSAGVGWDTATGWGPIIFSGFVTKVLNNPAPLRLEIAPMSVVGGESATGTVLLTMPARAGGMTLQLSSSDPSVVVPPSITVPTGASSATFPISTSGTDSVSASIVASGGGTSVTGTLAVNPPSLLGSMRLSSTQVSGGSLITGTITLSSPAPSYGLTVNLTSSSSSLSVPSTLNLVIGKLTASFSASSLPVNVMTPVTVSASQGGKTLTSTVILYPPLVNNIFFSIDPVTGGNPTIGTVTLNDPAGPNGASVDLSPSASGQDPSSIATMPSSVMVAAGAKQASFTIITLPVSSDTWFGITAETVGSGSSFGTAINVLTARLQSVTVSPQSVAGGNSPTGSIKLDGNAGPGGTTVLLSSSLKGTSVPSTVTIPSGSDSATFVVATTGVKTLALTKITATLNLDSKSATLAISPTSVASLSISPNAVMGGTPAIGLVSLDGAAPTGGLIVNLSSNSVSARTPSYVKIAPGATSGSFSIVTTGVSKTTSVSVKAKTGLTSASALLTIQPPTLVSLAISPTAVKGNATTVVTGTVSISGPAPPGGLPVNLDSSNTLAATVPSKIVVPAGKSSVSFRVGHKKVQVQTTTNLTATLSGASKSAALTVTP